MNPLEGFATKAERLPCLEGPYCKNSPSNSTRPNCNECRLSPIEGHQWFSLCHWDPINKKFKHPTLEKEKRDAKYQAAVERQVKKKAKDPTRQARARAAERAERKTNAAIIKATRNSGRVNKDGDHILFDSLTLDTKLQSKAENPTVNLHELDKVRADANRCRRLPGGLVIRNKHGRGIIVFDEKDASYLR